MKKRFLIVLCLLLLLAGCAKAPAEPAVTATTAPTVPTTEATKPTKLEPTEVTLPWDFPEVEPMTYEEYFSEKREVTENYCEDADRLFLVENDIKTVYSLRDEHGRLVLRRHPYDDIEKTLEVLCEDEENSQWMILAKDRAFAVQDDRSIIMLDLRTMEKSVLYTQEDGIVLLDMLYADNRLLFFVAGAPGHYTLYRMYLPEEKLDVMASDITVYYRDFDPFGTTPYDPSAPGQYFTNDLVLMSCTDNQSVCWDTYNPEYWDKVQEYRANYPEDVGGIELFMWLRSDVYEETLLTERNRYCTDGKTITQGHPTDWRAPIQEEDLEEIRKLFESSDPWYRYLAGCSFVQFSYLNVSDLFGQGDYPVVPFTEDMREGLEALDYEDVENLTLMHVSASEVEQVLKEYLGTTLEKTKGMAEDPDGGYLAVKRDATQDIRLTGGLELYDSVFCVDGTGTSGNEETDFKMYLKREDGKWMVERAYRINNPE